MSARFSASKLQTTGCPCLAHESPHYTHARTRTPTWTNDGWSYDGGGPAEAADGREKKARKLPERCSPCIPLAIPVGSEVAQQWSKRCPTHLTMISTGSPISAKLRTNSCRFLPLSHKCCPMCGRCWPTLTNLGRPRSSYGPTRPAHRTWAESRLCNHFSNILCAFGARRDRPGNFQGCVASNCSTTFGYLYPLFHNSPPSQGWSRFGGDTLCEVLEVALPEHVLRGKGIATNYRSTW